MSNHNLKIWPEWFDAIVHRRMEFQIRKNDRPFRAGDTLRLREYAPKAGQYTGRIGLATITCLEKTMPGMAAGYVAMGIFFRNLETKHNVQAEIEELRELT